MPKEVAVGFSIILHFLNLAPVWACGLFFLFIDHFGVSEIRKESMSSEFPEENEAENCNSDDDKKKIEIDEVKQG